MTAIKLKIECLSLTAKLPTRAHDSDAGFDLYANSDYTLLHGELAEVKTGVAMEIPEGYAGLIWDKSGLAKKSLKTMGGVIDAGYRGEIIVLIKNLNHDIHHVKKGQKIAQIIFQKIETPEIIEGKVNKKTKRSENGFGSTGLF